MDATDTRRPELVVLTDAQKQWVREQSQRLRPRCGGCGGDGFTVGDALYLGFLFVSEPQDAYLVALTCLNPGCPVRHSGINLHAEQLFGPP